MSREIGHRRIPVNTIQPGPIPILTPASGDWAEPQTGFTHLFAVNVRAPFFLVQRLLLILCEGSSIVLLSSLAARAAVGTLCAYAASKGAVDTLVKHIAAVLGPRGIRVNAVAPGVVQTDMSNVTKTDAGRDFTLGMQALKRLAKPEDIASALAFLASGEARWINGRTINVDSGSKL